MASLAKHQLRILTKMLSYKQLYILAYNKTFAGCNVAIAEHDYKEHIVPTLVEAQIREIRKELTESLLKA